MAGYSGTPLVKKLGVKAGARVLLAGAPTGFRETLAPLPEAIRWVRAGSPYDLAVAFVKRRAGLAELLAAAPDTLDADGALWIAWPKKASGVATELTEDVIRADAIAAGLVDNKVCAIDATWSGLRLVVRLEDRAEWRKRRK